LIVGGVAGHADRYAGGVAVGLGLERAGVGGAAGRDSNVEFLADFPDEGLHIGLAWLALAPGR
jgi:hypothetical protein